MMKHVKMTGNPAYYKWKMFNKCWVLRCRHLREAEKAGEHNTASRAPYRTMMSLIHDCGLLGEFEDYIKGVHGDEAYKSLRGEVNKAIEGALRRA